MDIFNTPCLPLSSIKYDRIWTYLILPAFRCPPSLSPSFFPQEWLAVDGARTKKTDKLATRLLFLYLPKPLDGSRYYMLHTY